MQAEVRIGDTTTDQIDVQNGLRQGCVLAPTLFNLYFNAVVKDWQCRCTGAGVCYKFRCGRRLVGDRTAKARLSDGIVTESQFADDAALYTTSREDFEIMTRSFIETAQDWGLTVSLEKIKGMVFGNDLFHDERATESVQVARGHIAMQGRLQWSVASYILEAA